MKLSHVTILASCAALALSQPLDKRVVVFETVTEEVIETVAVTTTHYIRPGEHAPSPSVTPSFKKYRYKHSHTKKRSVTPKPSPSETFTPPVEPVVTPEVKPVIIPEAPPTVTPEVPPPVITPEAQSVAPPEVPPVVTPEVPPPVITPEVKPVAPPEDPPVITPEASSATPVQTPSAAPQEKYEYSYSFDNQVVPPPSATPKVETPPASTGGSGGGACGEVGGKCSGDLTFYDAGLGACGWYNDGNSEAVFALAVGMLHTICPLNGYKNSWG